MISHGVIVIANVILQGYICGKNSQLIVSDLDTTGYSLIHLESISLFYGVEPLTTDECQLSLNFDGIISTANKFT